MPPLAPAPQGPEEPSQTAVEPKGPQQRGETLPTTVVLVAVAAILFVAWRYTHSASVRARRKLHAIVGQFEETLAGQANLSQEMQAAISGAAGDYIRGVRQSYLRAISLDEVRKLAPGVRLQPLYAQGIKNILDCQGWSAGRFLQLRGIGADSASRIWSACQALTKHVERQPIPHPRVTDGSASAKWLYARIYLFGRVQALLRGQKAAFEDALHTLRPRLGFVDFRVTFVRWLFGSESRGALKEAIDLVNATEVEASPDQPMGKALAEATDRLREARALSQSSISHEDLIADVAAKEAYYSGALENSLGPAPSGAPSRPAIAAQPPLLSGEPAYEPVPVGTPLKIATGFSIQGPTGLRIEIRTSGGTYPRAQVRGTKPSECWLPADKEVNVGGYVIRGGLIYVGRGLRSVHQGLIEPALIDPSQQIERWTANCHVRMLSYWSNYSYAAPAARASYLQWLEGGRSDPAADTGYVFLYFYGLERRALSDADTDPAAKAEVPTIVAEVRRLRSIYAANRSFSRYSADFLEYLEVTQSTQAGMPDMAELPALERNRLSFDLRRRLGLIANSGTPLPPNLAYIWYHNDPRSRYSSVAARCPHEVASLFGVEYKRRFGDGLILPKNKTKLKLAYKPASASFSGPLVGVVDLPDVALLSTTYSKIESVVMDSYRLLESYSRYVVRNVGQEKSLDALILLPPGLWPEAIKRAVQGMKEAAQQAGKAHTLKYGEFLSVFPQAALTKSKYIALCRALGGLQVGIEPDVRFGGVMPSSDDPIAVFESEVTERTTDGFGTATLMVQLASVVAAADGDFSEPEAQKLREHIECDWGLTPAEQQRLLARMATYRLQAPSTTGLKKTIETLDDRMKAAVLDLLLAMAYADGVLAPAEVRALEKIYVLFGTGTASLYTKLHDLAARPEGAPRRAAPKGGSIQLDQARVEQLKAESAEATRKLTVIFDTGGQEPSEPETTEEPAGTAEEALLGLDAKHAELLAVLLERPEWTRAEFEELCSDKGLMPDGAIETINEAAFTKFDQAVIEGEDTLEINTQLMLEEKAA